MSKAPPEPDSLARASKERAGEDVTDAEFLGYGKSLNRASLEDVKRFLRAWDEVIRRVYSGFPKAQARASQLHDSSE